MPRKVLAITGSRSDYCLMAPVFSLFSSDPEIELSLIVTAMNLMPEFSTSLDEIKKDAFGAMYFAETWQGDSLPAMAQAIGQAVIKFSTLIEKDGPDILLLQGDRGEQLAGAIVGAHLNIPMIHLSGGDYSGSVDDSVRNCLSKLSHLHFTTCSHSTARLLALGEARNRIVEVGEPGLDVIAQMKFTSPEDLASELKLDLSKPVILATQHPVTSEVESAGTQVRETLKALDALQVQTVFTYANSDAGGEEINKILEASLRASQNRSYLRVAPSLGSQKYLSLMRIASALVGNSSSGVWESPSFELPTVNIGTRQHGRLKAANVIDTAYDSAEIKAAIEKCLYDKDFRNSLKGMKNPYGDGHSAKKIIKLIKKLKLTKSLVTKWIDTDEEFLGEV